MRAAHTCIRSALVHAFRPQQPRIVYACAVPDFLVPSFSTPRRTFATSRRTCTEPSLTFRTSLDTSPSATHPTKRTRAQFDVRIPLPDAKEARDDIQLWLAAIDPFLPPHLRQAPAEESQSGGTASPFDFAWTINAARIASHDILSHIGLVEGRWDTVMWLVKQLVENGSRILESPLQLEPAANVIWPESEIRSLDDLTDTPLLTQRVRPSRSLRHSLDDLTAAPDSIDLSHNVTKQALGQLWRSLGNLILVAASRATTEDRDVMSHALEIIAYLHHAGLIPDSVYKSPPSEDDYTFQQPPTLHLLSSNILTALSDATWRAHEASVKVAKDRLNASYFLGHEIPGSRFKTKVTEVAPELWFELVLWSCLHGGWIIDGTAILENLHARRQDLGWRLISWRQLLQGVNTDAPVPRWGLFRGKAEDTPHIQDRALIEKTISSEVVTAFIDGLVNTMRVGVGMRGTTPEDLLHHIRTLKQLLDYNSLSLGSMSWDSIIVRLLESGGIMPDKRPELLLSMIDFASAFGTEIGSANANLNAGGISIPDAPYMFDPSASPIGMLHRTLRSFVNIGDISGAMATLQALQKYTDENKQMSLLQFFERLKSAEPIKGQPFANALAPIDFPGFDTQVPRILLARILDVITNSSMFDLGRLLIYSHEIDGPWVDRNMYHDWYIAAALIRFGTLARENDLVLNIVNKSMVDRGETQSLPAVITTALLSSQIRMNRWESVRGIQNFVLENPGYTPHATIISTFAATLLRCSTEANDFLQSPKAEARAAFKGFLFAWENLILTNTRNVLNCTLAIMSTVNDEWRDFCSQFLAFSTRQSIELSTEGFNQILGGVLDGFDSIKGKEIVDMWCYSPLRTSEAYRAPGGLPTMPQFRVTKSKEYEARPDDIVIAQPSGVQLILQGRIHANRQTILAVLRKLQQELGPKNEDWRQLTAEEQAEVRGTLRWAARLLYYLGFDYEDIIRDLGGLADLAELEASQSSQIIGWMDKGRDG